MPHVSQWRKKLRSRECGERTAVELPSSTKAQRVLVFLGRGRRIVVYIEACQSGGCMDRSLEDVREGERPVWGRTWNSKSYSEGKPVKLNLRLKKIHHLSRELMVRSRTERKESASSVLEIEQKTIEAPKAPRR